MEGICVHFLNLVQFFRFLKGRCHGNQFCVVSKTQTSCDFCNFYTVWMGFGCRWQIWNFFSISQGTLPWQPILFCIGLVRSEPKYLRIRWTDFHNLYTIWYVLNGRWLIRPSFSDSLRDDAMATNLVAKMGQNYLYPCTYCSVILKRNRISPCEYAH